MHDLDLLVPEAAIAGCGQALARDGWRTAEDGTDTALHHWSMVHPEGVARIELHRLPLPAPHARLLPAEVMLASATELALDGATIAIPSLSHQLVHLVAHGLLQHAQLESGRFLLRDLAEQALLTDGQAGTTCGRHANASSPRGMGLPGRLPAASARSACSPCTEPAAAPRRMLAARMLLQQRSRWAMQSLGPAGWLAARLAGVATGRPHARQPAQPRPPAPAVPQQDHVVTAAWPGLAPDRLLRHIDPWYADCSPSGTKGAPPAGAGTGARENAG